MFYPDIAHDKIVKWIQKYFQDNGPTSPVVIGISGGKDSTITAALCVDALGANRVLGVMMPNGIQDDFHISTEVCKLLDIKHIVCNIKPIIQAQFSVIDTEAFDFLKTPNDIVRFNNPARVRMTMLYLIANQIGGRVANTCNMSETYVGYDTAWGDQVGDFAPLQNLTVTEIHQLGEYMGLPYSMVWKTPTDGMCGQPDEDRFGFTYEVLDAYLRGAEIDDEIKQKIESMHNRAAWKNQRVDIPSFPFFPEKSCKLK